MTMQLEVGTRGQRLNRLGVRLISRLHIWLYRLTRGFVGGMIAGVPQLLLTTVGRRSGRHFTVPLFCLPQGEDLVVVASFGGSARPPQWAQNLAASGQGWVQLGGHRFAVNARVADPELRQRLWPVFCRYYPGYLQYQASTDRTIPLIVLTPSAQATQDLA